MYIVIKAFQFDGEWYANISNGEHGAILHTTDSWPTREDAEWSAMDWVNNNPRIKSGDRGPFLPDLPDVDTVTGQPLTEWERRENNLLPPV